MCFNIAPGPYGCNRDCAVIAGAHPFGETASQARTPSPQQASRFLRCLAGLVSYLKFLAKTKNLILGFQKLVTAFLRFSFKPLEVAFAATGFHVR